MTPTPREPRWESLAPGQWKTALKRDYPEIAILYLSNDEYKKFIENPKQYIDKLHILAKGVNNVRAGEILPASSGTGSWFIVIVHTPNSTVTYVATQQPLE